MYPFQLQQNISLGAKSFEVPALYGLHCGTADWAARSTAVDRQNKNASLTQFLPNV